MEKINYKKKYGQNFLYDENILENIIKNTSINEDDLIIEIGPGSGNLTKKLQTFNAQIIAFEIDETLSKQLDLIKNDKTKIIFKDFLEVDLTEELKNIKYKNIYIIANIPYYITTPIITKIINSNINPREIILMVQEEVADTLSAKPNSKEYGYITVYIQSFYNVTKLFKVGRNCFFPVPNVDSAIIKLTPTTKEINNLDKYNRLIEDAFKFKRKTLKNNLKNYNYNQINTILESHGFSIQNRAEQIPIDIFIEISNQI